MSVPSSNGHSEGHRVQSLVLWECLSRAGGRHVKSAVEKESEGITSSELGAMAVLWFLRSAYRPDLGIRMQEI